LFYFLRRFALQFRKQRFAVLAVLPHGRSAVAPAQVRGRDPRQLLVVHGDDLDKEALGMMYGDPRDLGILEIIPYANGISTTEIMDRVRRHSFTVVRP